MGPRAEAGDNLMKRVGLYSVHGRAVVLLLGLVVLTASAQAQSPGDMYTTYHGTWPELVGIWAKPY
jgi:hypothetical protein